VLVLGAAGTAGDSGYQVILDYLWGKPVQAVLSALISWREIYNFWY
jgi:hypothetical protein